MNFQLTKDQITTLTAGIVRTEILKEKWDGKRYWIKARIKADPEKVIDSINFVRKDKEHVRELENIKQRMEVALSEVKKLRDELNVSKKEQGKVGQYNEAIKRITITDWFERGYAASLSGNYSEAISAYNKAKELNPNDPHLYYNLGINFLKLNDLGRAVYNFDMAIELYPSFDAAYNWRGFIYFLLANSNVDATTNYRQALNDLNKAVALNPRSASAYVNRGKINLFLGVIDEASTDKALEDFNKAIEIDPSNAMAYGMRGMYYFGKGGYRDGEKILYFHEQAVRDFSKAIALNPTEPNIYGLRSGAYKALGKNDLADNDLKTAARLGLKDAQNQLNKKGIKW